MGSKYSKSNNEDIIKETKFLKKNKNKNYNCETEDLSIIMQNKATMDNSSVTTTTEVFDNSKIGENLVPFTFYWKGDCSKVTITGTFLNNWTTYIEMEKNEKTGYFERTFLLEKTKHQFKFIVGNDWVCSDDYEKVPNEYNNFNNFIDLTNYIYPKVMPIQKDKKNNNKKIIEELNQNAAKKGKKNYNCIYPEKSELNITAPSLMEHYRPNFDINYQSNQDLLNKYSKRCKEPTLEYKEKNFNTENNTFKKIMIWPHEKLSHLCPNIDDLNDDESDNYFKICTTIRMKHKYLTIVYYNPK